MENAAKFPPPLPLLRGYSDLGQSPGLIIREPLDLQIYRLKKILTLITLVHCLFNLGGFKTSGSEGATKRLPILNTKQEMGGEK